MKKRDLLTGYFFVIASAVIYGCMPLMATHIYADGVNPMTLVFLRNFLALPVLAVLAIFQHKTLKIPLATLAPISLLSLFGCCVTPVLLFSSYRYIPSGPATVLHFIYPCLVVVMGVLFFRKKVPIGTILSLILCLFGIGLFYKPGGDIHWGGIGLALSSGLTFATYVVLLSRYKNQKVTGFLFTFYIALASSVIAFLACVATGNLALPQSIKGWGLCLLFAIGVTVGAVVLFQQGTFRIGGERASILSTLEPITSVVVGVLLLGETIGLQDYFGAALVVAASILIAALDMKKK